MKKLIMLVSLALVLAACGGNAPAGSTDSGGAAAAPTAVPPTATPVPPTATPVPTPTPRPSANAKEAITAALAKAKEVGTYKLELTMNVLGGMGQEVPGLDPNEEVEMISLSGEFDGQDSHFTMKGFFAAFLGVDPEKGLEVISLDGKSYIHGPIPLMGATEDKWYIAEGSQSSLSEPPIKPGDLFEGFDKEATNLSALKSDGQEQIDGQSCDVYSGDKEATLALMKGTEGNLPTSDMLGEVEDASTKIAICEDGHVHQMQFAISGTAKDKPDQKASFTMDLHLFDFDSDITITAPENPATLETPQFEMPTTTTP